MQPITNPQLAAALAEFAQAVPGGIELTDIPAARVLADDLAAAAAAAAPEIPGIVSRDYQVSGADGAPPVTVRLYGPRTPGDALPGLLWIHGGGYVLGSVQGDDLKARRLSLALNCVVASVAYRLAPEHPFPAAIDDCYAALKWLAGHAGELGVDARRLAIGGASAGGGLAAGLSLLVRDRRELALRCQLLIYPMLDDTNVAPAGPGLPDTPVWTRASNLIGWRSYLGQEPGGEGISPYAAALRAEDLRGLPPTYIGVGTTDLFLSENMAYAQRLMQAGVTTECHVYADGFHGFDILAPESDVAGRFTDEYTRVVRRWLWP